MAAKNDEKPNDVVVRAVERELERMDGHARYEIHYEILGGNILTDSGDDNGTYDEEASIAKYAEMCEVALRETLPGAEVHVSYEVNVSGGSGSGLYVIDTNDDHMRYTPGDTGDGGRLADEANDVTDRVWESWDWLVYEES